MLLALVSGFASIMAYGLLFAGVYRLFTMANDLSEIKQLLRDHRIQRSRVTDEPQNEPWRDPSVFRLE